MLSDAVGVIFGGIRKVSFRKRELRQLLELLEVTGEPQLYFEKTVLYCMAMRQKSDAEAS